MISVIEKLYMAGLFSPVQFIGERKGTLTLIVASIFYFYDEDVINNYKQQINNITANVDFDSWSSDVGSFDRVPGSPQQTFTEGIINAEEHRVITYIRNVDSLWNLGTKKYEPEKKPPWSNPE